MTRPRRTPATSAATSRASPAGPPTPTSATQRAANAAVQAAIDDGAPQATIDELQATADEITGQRDSLFRGETLRGLLLSTYAWSTIGMIAGIAAIVSFIAAGVMAVLVVLGLIHRSVVP